MAGLKEKYYKKLLPQMMKEHGYKNPMTVPRLVKVVVNRGVGEGALNAKATDISAKELEIITGQKPKIAKAKKAISNFKLRKGAPIGAVVTLRGTRMYHFVDKLINLCLPKIRDFKGVNPKSFDGQGNYTFGIKEQLIFPEVDYDKIDKVRGMDITIVTSAKNNTEGRQLLKVLGMPFRKGNV